MAQTPDIRGRTLRRRIMYAKPTIVALILLVGFVAHASWGMYVRGIEARERSAKAAAELAALEERRIELEGKIEQLSSVRGIEEEIRERFMVAKDGEKVLVITKEEKDEEPVAIPVPVGE